MIMAGVVMLLFAILFNDRTVTDHVEAAQDTAQ
jgi:hypothetical protein